MKKENLSNFNFFTQVKNENLWSIFIFLLKQTCSPKKAGMNGSLKVM